MTSIPPPASPPPALTLASRFVRLREPAPAEVARRATGAMWATAIVSAAVLLEADLSLTLHLVLLTIGLLVCAVWALYLLLRGPLTRLVNLLRVLALLSKAGAVTTQHQAEMASVMDEVAPRWRERVP